MLGEEGGDVDVWVQDLVDLLLGLVVEAVLLLVRPPRRVLHDGEVIVALPLGPQADLITMVLDLGLVPQRHLDLTDMQTLL